MVHSLSKMYIHIIFHKKYNSPIILNKTKKELFAYMGAIIKENKSIPILINGVEDYVHVLFLKEYGIEYDEKYLWTD